MTTITYRDATVDDASIVEELFRLSFTDTFGHLYDPQDLSAFLSDADVAAWSKEIGDPEMAVRLAFVDWKPAGFARVGPGSMPKRYEGSQVELRQLYLLPHYKGMGLGVALLEWALQEARARRVQHLYLSVFIDNHRAKRLYQRYGFVEEGPYKFMVGNHADEDIVMRLDF